LGLEEEYAGTGLGRAFEWVFEETCRAGERALWPQTLALLRQSLMLAEANRTRWQRDSENVIESDKNITIRGSTLTRAKPICPIHLAER